MKHDHKTEKHTRRWRHARSISGADKNKNLGVVKLRARGKGDIK